MCTQNLQKPGRNEGNATFPTGERRPVAIEQAYRIQQRLRVWRPKRAVVMGSGTLGRLATLVLRLRGLDVTSFGNNMPPTLNSSLIEELGARYISTKHMSLTDASAKHGSFDLILEGMGYSPLVFEAMNVLEKRRPRHGQRDGRVTRD